MSRKKVIKTKNGLVLLFMMTTLICGAGWFCSKVEALTALKYIAKTLNKPPTMEELEACRDEVLKEMLRIK